MKKKISILISCMLISLINLYSQNNSVGIGTLTPDNSAVLDIVSTNQGLLIPRNNTLGITSISSPSDGLILYNTDDKCYWFWNVSVSNWDRLCDTDSLLTMINNLGDTIGFIYDSLAVHHTNITNNTTNINNLTTIINNHSDSLGWIYDSLGVHNTNIFNNTTNISNLYDSVSVINNHLGIVDSTLLEKWDLWGNLGTNPSLNFLGTTDNVDLVFRTNNTEKIRISNIGRVGIGTNLPSELLDINSNALRLRNGATNNYVLTTNASGVGTWQNPSTNPLISQFGNDWKLGGNNNVNLTNNILGTLTNFPIDIRTANVRRLHIDENGNFNMGFQNTMANVNPGNAADASYIMGWRNNVTKGSSYVIGYDNTVISTQNGNGGFFFGNNWTQNLNQVYNVGIGDGRNVDFSNQNGSIVMSVWDPGFAFQPVVTPTATGQFIVRTNNGATIYSSGNLTTGVQLTTGSGTWASISDETLKTNISTLDYKEVLNKVSNLEIKRWSYIAETAKDNKEIKNDVYHIGVMAQDFYESFELGTSNKLITTLDIGGVNMAAIKALIQENKDLKKRLELLEQKINSIDSK